MSVYHCYKLLHVLSTVSHSTSASSGEGEQRRGSRLTILAAARTADLTVDEIRLRLELSGPERGADGVRETEEETDDGDEIEQQRCHPETGYPGNASDPIFHIHGYTQKDTTYAVYSARRCSTNDARWLLEKPLSWK